VSDVEAALRMYADATNYVAVAGLTPEIQRQREADFCQFDECDLLREAAWVILCSGFREAAVRRVFDYISLCFCDWESAHAIVNAFPACSLAALASFNSATKIGAIFEVARQIDKRGFGSVRTAISGDPIGELTKFPFIGPITVWHLAKNLGLDVVKPDRHLVRISAALGFCNPTALCEVIAQKCGDPVRVIDLVIWRYMADNPKKFHELRPRGYRAASRAGHNPVVKTNSKSRRSE